MITTITRAAVTAAATAAATAASLALAVPAASAGTAACSNTPRCFGLLSRQARPLELATAVPAAQVRAGTTLVGLTPEGTAREDFRVSKGTDRIIRWAPRGVNSSLCVTATRDVAGSLPRLEPCQPGTAGSSHQVWIAVNVVRQGFRVYRNAADGLVLGLPTADNPGGAVTLRVIGAGTGANKNFALSKPF